MLKTTTYKYYIGVISSNKTSFTESELNKTTSTPLTSFTAPAGTSTNPFTVWIYPTSWGTVNSMKVNGETRNPWISPIPWNPTIPSGYVAYWLQHSGDESITDITWK